MKRPHRDTRDHQYHINNKTYPTLIGSRRQVWSETAYKTPGGLTKSQLHYNKKTGRIVSLKKHLSATKEQRLVKAGYLTRKGKFGAVRASQTRKHRTV
jgi:hypothetical protein